MNFYRFMDQADIMAERVQENMGNWLFSRFNYYLTDFTLAFLAGVVILVWLIWIIINIRDFKKKLKEVERKLDEEDDEDNA